jgi:transketolase
MDMLNRYARALTLIMIYNAKSGHPGGSLSVIDIIDVLAKEYLNWSHNYNHSFEKNSLILSKGHACPALYAIAAVYGLIDEKEILTFRKLNSRLQGHPDLKQFDWLGSSTGSLGQGFSVGIGHAMAAKHLALDKNVFTILGDGELQEGQVWEGAMSASHHNLDNLITIIDYNKLQSDDFNKNIMNLEPLNSKWSSFGWHTQEINGYIHEEILQAIKIAVSTKEKPSLIIAHTVKGQGVDFMENVPKWHGSVTMSMSELRESILSLGYFENELDELLNNFSIKE